MCLEAHRKTSEIPLIHLARQANPKPPLASTFETRVIPAPNMIEKIKLFYRQVWAESPWFSAIGYVLGPITAIYTIWVKLPSDMRFEIAPNRAPLVLLGIIIVYLLIVSALLSSRVKSERSFRERERAFRYDNRGTLYNNSEPNMAFHVDTFTFLLSGLSRDLGEDQLRNALVAVGYESCEGFASRFEAIYDADVVRGMHPYRWQSLGFRQKLDEWAEYESRSGWGIFTATEDASGIKVSLTHFKGLFRGDGGLLFGYYLAGYCRRLLDALIKSHNDHPNPGRYADYDGVEIIEIDGDEEFIVRLHYRWS